MKTFVLIKILVQSSNLESFHPLCFSLCIKLKNYLLHLKKNLSFATIFLNNTILTSFEVWGKAKFDLSGHTHHTWCGTFGTKSLLNFDFKGHFLKGELLLCVCVCDGSIRFPNSNTKLRVIEWHELFMGLSTHL